MDVDRRYYNKNTGSYLQQLREHQPAARLPEADRPAGARLRPLPPHRLRPLPRRAPAGVRALVPRAGRAELLAVRACRASSTRSRSNIEVAEGGHKLQGKQVYNVRALRVRRCPAGTSSRTRSRTSCCSLGCQASTDDIQKAVQSFSNPDVAVVEGRERRRARQQDQDEGAAAVVGDGDRAERQRRRRRCGEHLVPARPARLQDADPAERPRRPNAPRAGLLPHEDLLRPGAAARRRRPPTALQNLMQPADVAPLPRAAAGCSRSTRARCSLVVLGTAFHGTLAPAPQHDVAEAPGRRTSASTRRRARSCSQPLAKKVKFPLLTPTVLERTSYPDTLPGDKPVRRYYIERHSNKAVRLVFRTGGNEYWGIQETDWDGRAGARRQELPARPRRPRVRSLLLGLAPAHGRAARAAARRYWVVNTLARLALERDDARDRQGPQTPNNRKVGSARRDERRSGSSAPAGSASSRARASPSSATRS